MSPYQHGEVYVLDDGAETDLDLGHYERFTSPVDAQLQLHHRQDLPVGHPEGAPRRLPRAHRPGHPAHHQRDQGRDPQARRPTTWTSSSPRSAAPSATSRACRSSRPSASSALDVGRENCLYIHLTLVPFIEAAGELKTKPTQHSVASCRPIGIQPDILICRTDRFLDADIKRKIALFCNVERRGGHRRAKDVDTIYEVPLGVPRPRARRDRPRSSSACRCPGADLIATGKTGRAHQATRPTR